MKGSGEPASNDASLHFFIYVIAPPASDNPLWRSNLGGILSPFSSTKGDS
jgi:hypothetical protein